MSISIFKPHISVPLLHSTSCFKMRATKQRKSAALVRPYRSVFWLSWKILSHLEGYIFVKPTFKSRKKTSTLVTKAPQFFPSEWSPCSLWGYLLSTNWIRESALDLYDCKPSLCKCFSLKFKTSAEQIGHTPAVHCVHEAWRQSILLQLSVLFWVLMNVSIYKSHLS